MDTSTLRLVWHKYGRHAGAITGSLLLFAAGWHFGRTTSPYYAAHPIVFEDCRTAEAAGAPSGGDQQALETLQQAGEALADEKSQPAPGETHPDEQPAPEAAIAGTQTESPAVPAPGGGAAAADAQFVASRNSSLFHHISCPSVGQIKEENKAYFATAEQARGAGLTPSQCTQKLGY